MLVGSLGKEKAGGGVAVRYRLSTEARILSHVCVFSNI